MNRFFFLALITCSSFSSSAQTVNERVEKYALNLKLDTFIIYSYPCSGGVTTFDSCDMDESHYLFWKHEERYYLKRFDHCRSFEIILLGELNPLKFYLSNKQKIDIEKIKPPTHYEYKYRKNKIDTLIETSFVDHSCYHTFAIHIKTKLLT